MSLYTCVNLDDESNNMWNKLRGLLYNRGSNTLVLQHIEASKARINLPWWLFVLFPAATRRTKNCPNSSRLSCCLTLGVTCPEASNVKITSSIVPTPLPPPLYTLIPSKQMSKDFLAFSPEMKAFFFCQHRTYIYLKRTWHIFSLFLKPK